MAVHPPARVTPARPFTNTGLDYAGSFQVRPTKGRGHKAHKGYVSVFVCMVTRAVHLELVLDDSSQTFPAALRRFVFRRGISSTAFSYNETTFQGINTELQRLFAATSQFSYEIAKAFAADGRNWKFIPPQAPNFGGLRKAAVKGLKHHLRRVLGDPTLTYR